MAYDLTVYEDTKLVTVHKLTCGVYSTIPRQFMNGHVVKVDDEWVVRMCSVCQPNAHVVTVKTMHLVEDRPVYGPPEPPIKSRITSVRQLPTWASKYAPDRWHAAWHNSPGQWSQDDQLDAPPSQSDNDDWYDEGLCKNDGGRLGKWMNWLFTGEHNKRWAIRVQKGICNECPVRVECLEQGVWGMEAFGVWGGATLGERKRLRLKWEREGRRDGRPDRPHSRGGLSPASDGLPIGSIRSANGSRTTDQSGDEYRGTGETSCDYEAASGQLSEVRAEWDMQGPGPDEWADEEWGGESVGHW